MTVEDRVLRIEKRQTGKELAEALNARDPSQALALCVNGIVKDLDTMLEVGDEVTLLDFHMPEGKEVFWHSSAHILAQAILRLYPEAKPTIGPPIESGFYYDFANLHISEDDFPAIEKEIKNIIKENFKPERRVFTSVEEAKEAFKDNPYKLELIDSFDGGEITGYQQGEFFDLCRGPHLPALGKVKAMKLLKTSGAYWRGDSDREMLTRIYGISFPDKAELKNHLTMLEEAKKRDHRVLGQKLDLFSFKEEAPGMPFIHPKGMHIWNALIKYWREIHTQRNYVEILTPQLMSQKLWETSGHWEHYHENMFLSEIEERKFAIKPMNCPGCMLFYNSKKHSYRELPLRVAELGHVHRYEPSGAINGLFRVRSFHQDDAHIFLGLDHIKEEIVGVLELVDELYRTFSLEYHLELSTRPEKSIGSDEQWDAATSGLKDALDAWGHPYTINEGDGAFYGPKIDLHIRDAIGRSWQCGTIQLDFSLPEKFQLEYTDSSGEAKQPVIIHRAIFGSLERFFGILIEHYAGKFPLWLSPRQVRLLTVADRHADFAHSVAKKYAAHGIHVEVDDSQESVGKKVRSAQLDQVNYMLTVGDQELESNSVSVRTRDNVVHGATDPDTLLEKLLEEIRNR